MSYSESLNDLEPVQIMLNQHTEVFAWVQLDVGKPMSYIEAEIDAIEKMIAVKQFHKENGIQKPDTFYLMFKLQMMEMNETGIKRSKEFYFKDSQGNNIQNILN